MSWKFDKDSGILFYVQLPNEFTIIFGDVIRHGVPIKFFNYVQPPVKLSIQSGSNEGFCKLLSNIYLIMYVYPPIFCILLISIDPGLINNQTLDG